MELYIVKVAVQLYRNLTMSHIGLHWHLSVQWVGYTTGALAAVTDGPIIQLQDLFTLDTYPCAMLYCGGARDVARYCTASAGVIQRLIRDPSNHLAPDCRKMYIF